MKRYNIRPLLLAFLFFFASASCHAAETQDETTQRVEQLLEHLNHLTSLQFTFSQKTSGQMSGRPRTAGGEATLVRFGDTAKMRWNYRTPDRQIIISDGKQVLMYFEKLKQMIVSPADALQQDITYSLFTGKTDITHDFSIKRLISEKDLQTADGDSFDVIQLTPSSPNPSILSLTLWITQKNRVKRIEIRDSFDTITLLNLSNIRENELQAENTFQIFQFTPPSGTEVIHQ